MSNFGENVKKDTIKKIQFLVDKYDFQGPKIVSDTVLSKDIAYLKNEIGIEVELDVKDKWFDVYISKLNHGKLPGYFQKNSQGKIVESTKKTRLSLLRGSRNALGENFGNRHNETHAEKMDKYCILLEKEAPDILSGSAKIFNSIDR